MLWTKDSLGNKFEMVPYPCGVFRLAKVKDDKQTQPQFIHNYKVGQVLRGT